MNYLYSRLNSLCQQEPKLQASLEAVQSDIATVATKNELLRAEIEEEERQIKAL